MISARFRKVRTKRIAILGGRGVGKTTLLRFLTEGELPVRATQGLAPEAGGEFELGSGSATAHFTVGNDVPGANGVGYVDWKKAFKSAHYVLYLFRSDLIAQANSKEIVAVKRELNMIQGWMKASGDKRPKVVLVGTFADADSNFSEDAAGFQQFVAQANPINLGVVKLNNARLVVGSLSSRRDARILRKSLAKHLP